MVFVSENVKNRNFLTFMSVFMVFVSVRMEKQELSHIYGCQEQFMFLFYVCSLSVRMDMLDANAMRLFG